MTDPLEERVRAAITAGTNEVPGELLERIRASRADGMRAVLPIDASGNSWRALLWRGTVAAAIVLVCLAAWSLRSRTESQQANRGAANGAAGLDVFGLGSVAFAQEAAGPQTPKYAAMQFDAARLRPIRVHYVRRFFYDGKQNDVDSSRTYHVVNGPGDEWLIVTERRFADSYAKSYSEDTLHLVGPDLQTQSESYFAYNTRGDSTNVRTTIHGDSATVHNVERYIRDRKRPAGQEIPADSAARVQRGASGRASAQKDRPMAPISSPDTVTSIRDTVLAIGHTPYPRLTSMMNDAELIFKLMAVKLDSTWKRSIMTTVPGGVMVIDHTQAYIIPVDLKVAGTATCTSQQVTTSCWKVLRIRPTSTTTFLVRKSDGVTVWQRTESVVDGKKFAMQIELVDEQ